MFFPYFLKIPENIWHINFSTKKNWIICTPLLLEIMFTLTQFPGIIIPPSFKMTTVSYYCIGNDIHLWLLILWIHGSSNWKKLPWKNKALDKGFFLKIICPSLAMKISTLSTLTSSQRCCEDQMEDRTIYPSNSFEKE